MNNHNGIIWNFLDFQHETKENLRHIHEIKISYINNTHKIVLHIFYLFFDFIHMYAVC